MDIKEQITFYDKYWAKRQRLNSLKLMRAIKMLDYFSYVKRKLKNPKTLDLGCGDGRFTAFLGEFADTEALELSKDAVKIANEKHPHVKFFQGDALTYEFESNTYDLVVSQEVIEHIEDQEKYFNVCSSILKPGGYLIMTTPNKKVFDHLEGGNWSKQPVENILDPRTFKKLLKQQFNIITYDSIIYNFGHIGYFKLINHRLLVGSCNRLGLNGLRHWFLSKSGFGLHQCVLARKKS